MNEKKSNIRLVKTGGRRVTKTTTEYDWNGLDKRTENSTSDKPKKKRTADLERRVRYQKKQKALRLKRQRRRALAILIVSVIAVNALLFLTPIFNIRSVTVEGNRLVSAEQFQEILKPLVGENLFRSGSGKIRKSLKSIAYISTVEVEKKIFPPSVNVKVTEHTPAGIMKAEDAILLVNSELRVLSDAGEMPEPVPVITGFSVKSFEKGEILKTDDSEKKDVLTVMLATVQATGIIDKVIEINVNDVSDIRMNYDDRIDVLCGSTLDMGRKIRLFKETVTSNSLAENARGTMDLSEVGKAVYTP